MISLRSLDIGYRRGNVTVYVQRNLNLTLEPARLVSLLGPNGCGKSTLLCSLCGLLPVLGGEVLFDGVSLSEMSLEKRARTFALVLTQNPDIAYCTVAQLVAMGRCPYTGRFGRLSAADRRKVGEVMEQVHISHLADKQVREISDGERQRTMIAKALAQDTSVIFLDEPTSHLDLPNRVEVTVLLARLARETGKSILISSHDLELSLQVSDSIWLMRPQQGGVEEGSPACLLAGGAIQSDFENPFFHIGTDGKIQYEQI